MRKIETTRQIAYTLALTVCGSSGVHAEVPKIEEATGGMEQAALAAGLQFPLDTVGYREKEFLLSGTAASYAPQGGQLLPTDGKWEVDAGDSATYTTRAIVYRPIKDEAFNGTVIVEWMNVTSGSDSSPIWIYTHNELIREGYILVSLSAQAAGVESIKEKDLDRYGRLQHPGDIYSYDIFSQAGQAVRAHAETLLVGLKPQRVLAAGESQSAYRLATYVNAVQPKVSVYDGFLLQSRAAKAAYLASPEDVSDKTKIREDLSVPVLVFQSETDVNEVARQPETSTYRLWEVAGTAHFDAYGGGFGLADMGDGQGALHAIKALQEPPSSIFGLINCDLPINTGPMNFVISAAVHALNEWVRTGVPPATTDRLQATDFKLYNPEFVRDDIGIARGGIRTPFVDAPLATLSGTGNAGDGGWFCQLFGTTRPLDTKRLNSLYPT
ncbi:MAG TPA: hypothetical protein EYN10_03565, partial [Gammaproteobacteria bacterium]|nr:hypothetical protein [Gammaproteobacteria bacterium]